MTPKRIQLKRAKGFRLQTVSRELNGLYAMKVDRSTLWGNPFKDGTAAQRVILFRKLLTDPQFDLGSSHKFFMFTADRLRQHLRGFNLACWCRPGTPCHADVLLEIANSPAVQHSTTQPEKS
jgi:Domain of unknown function (DUF4326)